MVNVNNHIKTWFKIHFFVDYLFGIPLMLFPTYTLRLFGFSIVEPVTARLVGAALLGIGGISLIARNETRKVMITLLNLKLIWSISAIFGLTLSLIQGAPPFTFIILLLFAGFSALWIWCRKNIS